MTESQIEILVALAKYGPSRVPGPTVTDADFKADLAELEELGYVTTSEGLRITQLGREQVAEWV